jgi:ERCC4-type nuclease
VSDARPTIIIDSREQTPWMFPDNWPTEKAGLVTGDYSLKNFTDLICIERKSLSDLVGCVGKGRDRFKRELKRMQAYKCRAVVVEATYKRIIGGNWRGKVKPEQVLGSIASWGVRYNVEFIFAGDAELAALWAVKRMQKYHDLCREYAKRFN